MIKDTAGVSTQFLSVALSVSLNRFSMKETTFCPKADNFAYFFTPFSHSDWLIWTKVCLCYTNRWLIRIETRTRPPTCKVMSWTSNVYEIVSGKGFFSLFPTGIPTKIVDSCLISWMLLVFCELQNFLWIVWSDAIWGQLCEIAPSRNIRRPVSCTAISGVRPLELNLSHKAKIFVWRSRNFFSWMHGNFFSSQLLKQYFFFFIYWLKCQC